MNSHVCYADGAFKCLLVSSNDVTKESFRKVISNADAHLEGTFSRLGGELDSCLDCKHLSLSIKTYSIDMEEPRSLEALAREEMQGIVSTDYKDWISVSDQHEWRTTEEPTGRCGKERPQKDVSTKSTTLTEYLNGTSQDDSLHFLECNE